MTITRETLVAELRLTLPHFRVDEAYADEGLEYPIIGDLARYVVEQSDWGDEEELRACLAFVERCFAEGDSYVRDLAHDCVESICVGQHAQSIRSEVGANTAAVWDEIRRH